MSMKSISKFGFLILLWALPLWGQVNLPPRKSRNVPQNSMQTLLQIGSWKENSILLKSDGNQYKINTLNTVVRVGMQHIFWKQKLYAYYGLVSGFSKNINATDDFNYFQRSVLLSGGEFAFGMPLLSTATIDLIASVNGIFRTIQHSVPNENYKFKTASNTLYLLVLELSWKMSDSFFWRQSIGTQGIPLDTFWAAGLGYGW